VGRSDALQAGTLLGAGGSQANNTQTDKLASGRDRQHPHALLIASLLLSAYQEFLQTRRGLDYVQEPSYNGDKNICTGGRDGELG
jgi:hypothetical protein